MHLLCRNLRFAKTRQNLGTSVLETMNLRAPKPSRKT